MNSMTILLLALANPVACPQEGQDGLTPARTMELLEDAHRMMGRAERLLNDGRRLPEAEKREMDAADKLGEIIKKARSSSGRSRDPQQKQNQRGRQSDKSRPPGNPAKDSHDPNRADSPSKFKSPAVNSGAWGKLPPNVRSILLEAAKDEIPPEFLEVWRKYGKLIEDSAK